VNFQNTNKLHHEDRGEPSSDDTFELLHSKANKNEKGILDSSSESNGEEDLLNLSQTDADPGTIDRRQHEEMYGQEGLPQHLNYQSNPSGMPQNNNFMDNSQTFTQMSNTMQYGQLG